MASLFIFLLLHSTAIKPQEAKESIDEEDPRPTSSTWSYIRVFTLNDTEASKSKDLIQGKCFINGIPLLVLFDSGATHSFISYLCVGKLKLFVSSLNKDLVVETPTSASVLTSNVCLNCPVEIFGRTFVIDLICLPFEPN